MKKGIKANVIRNRILELLKIPRNVTQLKKELKEISSFGTLSYHLRLMKEQGLISSKKQIDKQGQPTEYYLKELEKQIRKFSSMKELYEHIEKGKQKVRIETLKMLKEKPQTSSAIDNHILKKYEKEYGDGVLDDVMNLLLNERKGLTITKHFITIKGREFLRKL